MATVDITIQAANATPAATPTEDADDEVATTVAYQLKVDQITHSFREPAVPLSLPTSENSKDQLRNQMITLGMRNEEFRLSGVLIDRGAVSASNPRRQTLLDIARVQWVPIIAADGKPNSSPDNPNSYLLLTIGSDTEPDDSTRGYRGMISELSFINMGGRPDIWRWQMSFIVVMNEHDY